MDYNDDPLALATLKALEQIGDEREVKAVETLIHKTKQTEVREAAEACLLFLQIRANFQGTTLLRPSDSAHVRPETLLRPASAQETVTDPDQLLRPVE